MKILIVEDEPAVLVLSERVLREEGYNVLTARDGVEALAIAGHYKRDIDLLFTDVMMPHMNVNELVQELRCARPDVKIVFSSGYTEEVLLKQGTTISDFGFLEKPFSPTALREKIRRTLDGQPKAS